jgi:AraC-like DNA-binding protein
MRDGAGKPVTGLRHSFPLGRDRYVSGNFQGVRLVGGDCCTAPAPMESVGLRHDRRHTPRRLIRPLDSQLAADIGDPNLARLRNESHVDTACSGRETRVQVKEDAYCEHCRQPVHRQEPAMGQPLANEHALPARRPSHPWWVMVLGRCVGGPADGVEYGDGVEVVAPVGHLRTGQPTLAQVEVAERTGYASPYAFAAAFRRHHGQPPGAWRQQQRERPTPRDDGTATADDGIHFA